MRRREGRQDPERGAGALILPEQYLDRETGLHYDLNRYYDLATRRYLRSHPNGLACGRSTYTHARGSPNSQFDPFGLEVVETWIRKPFPQAVDVHVSLGEVAYPDRITGGKSGNIWARIVRWSIELSFGPAIVSECSVGALMIAVRGRQLGSWIDWMDVLVPNSAPAAPHPGGYYVTAGRLTYSWLIMPAHSVAMDIARDTALSFEHSEVDRSRSVNRIPATDGSLDTSSSNAHRAVRRFL